MSKDQKTELAVDASLRDYFAAHAMPVFMNQSPSSIGTRDPELARQYIATASYAIADAMLAARSK